MLERYVQRRGCRWGAGAAAAVLITVLVIGASIRSTTADPQYPPIPGETIIRGNGWEVKTEVVDGRVAAGVLFSSYDRDSLLTYAEAVRVNAPAAFLSGGTIPALVTFRYPIPLDTFPQLMADAGATVISYRIRTMGPDGQRGTIGGAPEPDGTVLDLEHVADFKERQEKKGNGPLQVLGVVDAEVVIDRDAYAALSAREDEVFLVDVMRAVAVSHLPDQARARVPVSGVRLEPLYWHLEDAGLAQ